MDFTFSVETSCELKMAGDLGLAAQPGGRSEGARRGADKRPRGDGDPGDPRTALDDPGAAPGVLGGHTARAGGPPPADPAVHTLPAGLGTSVDARKLPDCRPGVPADPGGPDDVEGGPALLHPEAARQRSL